jgi:hypothetical protein
MDAHFSLTLLPAGFTSPKLPCSARKIRAFTRDTACKSVSVASQASNISVVFIVFIVKLTLV